VPLRLEKDGVVDGQQHEVTEQLVSRRAVVVGRIDAQRRTVDLGDGQLPVAAHQITIERG
jgi:hypothetical protein